MITFNGVAGQVQYSSLTYVGLSQINVTIPRSAPSGDVPVVAQAGYGMSLAAAVTAVQ